MKLEEMNTLRAQTFDELQVAAKERGIDTSDLPTADSLRLAIIHAIIEEEDDGGGA